MGRQADQSHNTCDSSKTFTKIANPSYDHEDWYCALVGLGQLPNSACRLKTWSRTEFLLMNLHTIYVMANDILLMIIHCDQMRPFA